MAADPPEDGVLTRPSLVWHVVWPAVLPLQPLLMHLTNLDGSSPVEKARQLEAILQVEVWGTSVGVSILVSAATGLFIRYRARLRGSPGRRLALEIASSTLLFLVYLLSRPAVELGALILTGVFFLGAGRMEPGPIPLFMPCLTGLLTAVSIGLARIWARRPGP